MTWKRAACFLLAAVLWITGSASALATVNSLQNQKAQNEKELKNIQNQISNLQGQRDSLSSEVSGLNDELTDVLLNIEVLQSDLEAKEQQIAEAEIAYEEAKAVEERQYESMKLRIQYLYETGDSSYLELLLTSQSVAELVNKVEYAEEIQEYDDRLLKEYEAARQAVIELQNRLAEEKAELLEIEAQMEEEKANLQAVIDRKRSEIEDFDAQLANAKAKASSYQKKIKEQAAQIKKLQEEEARAKAAVEASSSKGSSKGSRSESSGTTASVSGGTGLGASIASFGLRYVGYPYVSGGNSLTNGTDCSGFVHLVHANFGISTPRQSGSIAGAGRAVSDGEKLPGDVVCYYGHVGIYIGNNQIVHASTPASGIKVSNMYYRSIRCIRRYW